MKAFETDWTRIFALLPAWTSLSQPARHLALVHLKPSAPQPAGPLAAVLEELRANGFAELSPTGKRVDVPAQMSELIKLLRELHRAPVWADPSSAAAVRYLEEHFTSGEISSLGQAAGTRSWGWIDRKVIAELATSVDWIEGFLACSEAGAVYTWEHQRRESGAGVPRRFRTPEVFAATQQLVRALLTQPAAIPLSDLPALLPDTPEPVQTAALQAALSYLLAFAGLDRKLMPLVGAWPPVIAWLNRPAPVAPVAIEVAQGFHAAVLMEDMTSVLVAMSSEPLRLRLNDRAIFARTSQLIAERLIAPPDWTDSLIEPDSYTRIETACEMLELLVFAVVVDYAPRGRGREERRLTATAEGARWLGLSDHDRLAHLLDLLRKQQKLKRRGWEEETWSFSPYRTGQLEEDDQRGLFAAAFLSLPEEGYVSLAEFLDYQTATANPLLDESGHVRAPARYGFGRTVRREHAEQLWEQMLVSFLGERLVALGGARVGITEDGRICVGLTSVGRYLLGAVDEFEYGTASAAQVIVQPNFEIVFLTPAPKLEAQFGRFAERVGRAPGVVFRLTRAAVLNAAEAGLTQDQLLGSLEAGAREPVPANVARQIVDWMGEVRRVRLRAAFLVECSDTETAARVSTALGKQVRTLTPTLLETTAHTRKAQLQLQRQLRAAGVFVQEESPGE